MIIIKYGYGGKDTSNTIVIGDFEYYNVSILTHIIDNTSVNLLSI